MFATGCILTLSLKVGFKSLARAVHTSVRIEPLGSMVCRHATGLEGVPTVCWEGSL